MLYIVSTPIGNLKDMSFRAIETLKSVDLIAAEDTRHSKILCNEYQISTPLTSFFEHNQTQKTDYLIKLLKEGKNIALISDAGTPGVSDPGFVLVRAAHQNNIPLTVIPGPTALIAALTLSGLPCHQFIFEGFLPPKSGGRRKKLESFKNETRTVIFYESPYRILKTLKDMVEVLEDPTVVCVREISKKFEEVKKDRASKLLEHFTNHKPLGEFVLLFNLSETVSLN